MLLQIVDFRLPIATCEQQIIPESRKFPRETPVNELSVSLKGAVWGDLVQIRLSAGPLVVARENLVPIAPGPDHLAKRSQTK